MTQVINPLVEWLLSHAYGQGGSVAVPSRDTSAFQAPKGEFPPGISDVLDHLSQRYLSWSSGHENQIDWCFLVGGPGNGKSECLRTLADRLGVQLPARGVDQPVPRTVPLSWPNAAQVLSSGLEIAFINDASIPRTDAPGPNGPGSLFLDVSDALRRPLLGELPVALFASVNRGILVEETRGLEGQHAALNTPEGKLASELVRWLAKPPAESVLGNGSIETTVGVAPLAPQYGQCKLTLPGNRRIVIHAIFLDVLSLLEPRPGEGQPVVDFSSAPPLVASYRTLGSLRSMHVSRDETTAGRLVKEFMQDDKWLGGGCRDPATGEACEAFPTCPFAQNASWLRHDSLRQRFLDAMRAAEIAAGRRFTYRDLLGHVSLALLGQPEEAWLGGTSPCKWSSQQKQHAAEGKKQSAVALQFHRLYVNLFGSGLAESKLFSERAVGVDSVFGAVKARRERSGEATRIQSFERAFQDIDPACDTDPWDGMRGKALDAVESLDVQSPSEQLSQWPGIPAETLCKIEFDLDHLLREEIISELTNGSRPSARRVRALRRWRSTLMLRQVGLALGNLNFGTAIHAWLAEQENALCSGPRMKLGDGLANLIIPLQVNQRAFLAPFRPRTFCLSQLPPDTVLVSVATTDLVVVVRPQGDTLVAEVQLSRARERKAPQTLAGLVIDLAVAREALLHGDGDVRSFTEIGYTAFARIERARASLISRARLRTMPAYFTDPAGQPFRVSANPGGGVPLRAERA